MEENFKRLQKVKDVLLDDKKRAIYDRAGEEGLNRPPSIFDAMNDQEQKGESFVKKIGVELSDLYKARALVHCILSKRLLSRKGLSKKLRVTKKLLCPDCKGVGTLDKANVAVCRSCGGQGKQLKVLHNGIMVQQVRYSSLIFFKPSCHSFFSAPVLLFTSLPRRISLISEGGRGVPELQREWRDDPESVPQV